MTPPPQRPFIEQSIIFFICEVFSITHYILTREFHFAWTFCSIDLFLYNYFQSTKATVLIVTPFGQDFIMVGNCTVSYNQLRHFAFYHEHPPTFQLASICFQGNLFSALWSMIFSLEELTPFYVYTSSLYSLV